MIRIKVKRRLKFWHAIALIIMILGFVSGAVIFSYGYGIGAILSFVTLVGAIVCLLFLRWRGSGNNRSEPK